jgi:hypothetical protein
MEALAVQPLLQLSSEQVLEEQITKVRKMLRKRRRGCATEGFPYIHMTRRDSVEEFLRRNSMESSSEGS